MSEVSRVNMEVPMGEYVTRLQVLAIVIVLTSVGYCQDTVHVSSSAGSSGYAALRGQVLDYSGRGLVLELPDGDRQTFPAERILHIETHHTRAQQDADALFDSEQFVPAIPLYERALTDEDRRWMRRRIMAQLVWCHRAMGQLQAAGEKFRLVVWEDANSPYLACIPLTWIAGQPSGSLERAATGWLNLQDQPAMVLLGASHLLSTTSRTVALDRLQQLVLTAEPPVNQLALAQTWRALLVTADAPKLKAWEETIHRIPEPLRAGPYYVLGQGWAGQRDWERSAVALMRVPVLYRRNHILAARSLLDAGQALERLDRRPQAARLYDEVLGDFAQTPSAAEAQVRRRQLETKE